MTVLLDPPNGAVRDQRSMIGLRQHASVGEVEDAWADWVRHHGLPVRRRLGDYSQDLRHSGVPIVAYVSGGKWIADCPLCADGIAGWYENPRGCCLGCGTIFHIDHPPVEDVRRAHDLLAARPQVGDRSWHRQNGETLDELAAENDELARRTFTPPAAISSLDVMRVFGEAGIAKMREAGVSI